LKTKQNFKFTISRDSKTRSF